MSPEGNVPDYESMTRTQFLKEVVKEIPKAFRQGVEVYRQFRAIQRDPTLSVGEKIERQDKLLKAPIEERVWLDMRAAIVATVTDLPLVPLKLYQFDRRYYYKWSDPDLTPQQRRRVEREWAGSSPAQAELDELMDYIRRHPEGRIRRLEKMRERDQQQGDE
jgi:hypothetical protein